MEYKLLLFSMLSVIFVVSSVSLARIESELLGPEVSLLLNEEERGVLNRIWDKANSIYNDTLKIINNESKTDELASLIKKEINGNK